MSKDKQIEEIRKDIFAAFGGYAKWEEDWKSLAEAVYNAGYRKQTGHFLVKENGDIVPLWNGYGKWVKEHRFSRNYDDFFRYICSRCGRAYDEPSNFCPNCGAHMKGGH